MVNDSSLATDAKQFAFDLETQNGVTNLLVSVRASEISTDQKNELRDLIFMYTNGGKEPSVRISIEQKVSAYGVTPVAPIKNQGNQPSPEPEPAKPFGTSRPAPSFSPVSTQPPAVPTPTPAQTPVADTPPTPPPASQPAPQPVSAPPAPAPEPVPPAPTSTPAPAPVQETEKTQPAPAPAPVPVTAPSPEPVEKATPADLSTPDQNLKRIREIKSAITEKIGNPVNLVDINNEVGREYMSAMLDAMKKVNTGSAAVSAMQRLETAYQSVEKVIAENAADIEIAKPNQDEAKVNVPEEVVAPKTASTPPEVKREPAPVPVTPDINPEPVQPPMPEPPKPQPAPVAPVSQTAPAPKAEVVEPVMDDVVENNQTPPVPEAPALDNPTPEPVVPPSPNWSSDSEKNQIPQTTNVKAASLADTKTKLRKPDELPSAADLNTSSVDGDPLYTKEVDQGLEQLLAEWSIFKKSGLFGTGPKGREHPLFTKVAALQVPLLLAGRFEGATQEIKQSITDYMNGWRYEQGIIYEHGETFEHYLRRVIRHILDLQNRSQAS